ncbi:MAG: hypothetical protein IJV04_01790, partial [Lachnospiraceae bacterium]|nr:hypothetical protein [Lachnospiraceae bacterium]
AMLFVPKIETKGDMDPEAAVRGMAGKVGGALANKLAGAVGSSANQDVMALRNLVKKKKQSGSGSFLKRLGSNAAGQLLPDVVQRAATKTSYADIQAGLAAKGYVSMEMQYNPNSVRIYTTGGQIRQTQGTGDIGQSVYSDGKTRSTLSAQLVFQDVAASDAFWYEGMNYARAVNSVASTIKTVATGYSIQKPVNGLLSLMHFKRSKQVIFFWSEMFFHGELVSVQANYQMFNKVGHPIKATVDIQIQEPDLGQYYKSDNQAWDQAFDMAFGEAGLAQITKF